MTMQLHFSKKPLPTTCSVNLKLKPLFFFLVDTKIIEKSCDHLGQTFGTICIILNLRCNFAWKRQTRNNLFFLFIFLSLWQNHCAVKCIPAGTWGCMRTWYASGWERKMRQGRVMRPEGDRGTLLTDCRPDILHRPHSFHLGNRFLFTHLAIPPSQPPCRRLVLYSFNLQPCQPYLP